ncbi:MAG: type II toxin-antitoxin system HigB family toxin [Chitinophagaceae bacterium]|nr:type II toxin-antitoxin system HigB family toxin [Chitinophagaceae bacterium]
MVIITKGAIHTFAKKHLNALIPLNDWYDKTKEAQWRKFSEIRLTFNSVDSIGSDRYVFDIGGNNFRIIAMIHFDIRTVYIRAILTHPEYDLLNKANKLTGL